jgi:hypothetical protein
MSAALWPVAAIIVAFLLGFACCAWLARLGDPLRLFDDAADEHADWPGADAGFSNHSRDI